MELELEWDIAEQRYRNFTKDGKMVMITGSGLKESHPHDVIITKAPNYSL